LGITCKKNILKNNSWCFKDWNATLYGHSISEMHKVRSANRVL
jgi:hypothetical protein